MRNYKNTKSWKEIKNPITPEYENTNKLKY